MEEKIKELKKGCGKKLRTGQYESNRYCNNDDLCPICQAKLKGYLQGQSDKEKEIELLNQIHYKIHQIMEEIFWKLKNN